MQRAKQSAKYKLDFCLFLVEFQAIIEFFAKTAGPLDRSGGDGRTGRMAGVVAVSAVAGWLLALPRRMAS